jgi:TolA-binding protein
MSADLSQRLMAAINAHQSGQLDVAKAAYRSVLADHPNQPDALHYLGMIYYQEEDCDRALDYVGRARTVKQGDRRSDVQGLTGYQGRSARSVV